MNRWPCLYVSYLGSLKGGVQELWNAKGTQNPRHCCQSRKDPFGCRRCGLLTHLQARRWDKSALTLCAPPSYLLTTTFPPQSPLTRALVATTPLTSPSRALGTLAKLTSVIGITSLDVLGVSLARPGQESPSKYLLFFPLAVPFLQQQ